MQTQGTICYGLSRSLGAVGFMAGGAVVFYIAQSVLHVTVVGQTVREASPRAIVVFVAAVLGGLVGMVFGKGLGYSIQIANDGLSSAIDGLWHFGANTTIFWTPNILILHRLVMGREAAKAFWANHGVSDEVWLGFMLPLLVGWSIAILYWLSVRLVPRIGCLPAMLIVWPTVNLGPYLLSAAVGGYEASILGMNHRWGWLMALMPLLIVPATLHMMKKDAYLRLAG
jgi:hypothetical protein